MVSKIHFSRASEGPKPFLRPVHIEDKICKQLAALEAPLKKATLQERDIALIERRYKEGLAQAADVPNSKPIRDKAKEVRQWIAQARRELKRRQFEETMANFAKDDRPENIFKVLSSAEPSRSLLQAAQDFQQDVVNHPNLTLVYVNAQKSKGCYALNGEISLRASLSFKSKVAYTLFELTNAINRSENIDLIEKAKKREITDAEYATQIEASEYEGVKCFSEIMQRLIREYGWDPDMDGYSDYLRGPWATFQGYLAEQMANGHYREYIKEYHAIQRLSSANEILIPSE